MKVNISACYYTADEQVEAIKDFKQKYNVVATYFDGGDQMSYWTLEGAEEDIKRYLVENGFGDVIGKSANELKSMSLKEIEEYAENIELYDFIEIID
jgi:hypothetical protein